MLAFIQSKLHGILLGFPHLDLFRLTGNSEVLDKMTKMTQETQELAWPTFRPANLVEAFNAINSPVKIIAKQQLYTHTQSVYKEYTQSKEAKQGKGRHIQLAHFRSCNHKDLRLTLRIHFKKDKRKRQVWWHLLIILALKRWRQVDP